MEKEIMSKHSSDVNKSTLREYKSILKMLWKKVFARMMLGRISDYSAVYDAQHSMAIFRFIRKDIPFEIYYDLQTDNVLISVNIERK